MGKPCGQIATGHSTIVSGILNGTRRRASSKCRSQLGRRLPNSSRDRLDVELQKQSAVENPRKNIGKAQCSAVKCYSSKVTNDENNVVQEANMWIKYQNHINHSISIIKMEMRLESVYCPQIRRKRACGMQYVV